MIDTLKHWLDLLLHADTSLQMLVTNYQGWTYLILFTIIFCETGLVVTPFLPGDSLLFAAGVIASSLGVLNIYALLGLIFIAAFAGDNSNYFIGNYIGPKIFNLKLRFIRKDYLERTHAFYEKHGGKTIIIARFIPIIRTFAPFVARRWFDAGGVQRVACGCGRTKGCSTVESITGNCIQHQRTAISK